MELKYSNLGFSPSTINEEEHSIKAVFSSNAVDRHGEVVDQKSWNLKEFAENPVVLFSHDHNQPPIGKVIDMGYNADGNLEGTVKFAAAEYPFANVIYQLYKGGFMKAFSVGFSAGQVVVEKGVPVLKDNTLYELSCVSVPANAMALAKSKGIDTSSLEEIIKNNKSVAEADDAVVDKGAISTEINQEEIMEQKWANMSDFCDITSALWTVYMDEATDVDAFPTLLTETAGLISKLADNYTPGQNSDSDDGDDYEETFKDSIQKKITDETIKELGRQIMAQLKLKLDLSTEDKAVETIKEATEVITSEKVGRMLSNKNRDLIQTAHDSLKTILDADSKDADTEETANEDKPTPAPFTPAPKAAVTKPTEPPYTPKPKAISTTVEIPAIVIPAKKHLSNKAINKAVRDLLKLKRQ